jgi:O-methyltransferase
MDAIKKFAKRHLPASILNLARSARSSLGKGDLHAHHEHDDRYEFFRRALVALKFNGIDGDYAEFGCWGAGTFRMVYHLLDTYNYPLGPFHLWAFDSFQGLPKSAISEDEHPQWFPGNMATALEDFERICREGGIPRSAYTTVPGFYQQSLAQAAPGPRPQKIRLAFVDCDMYSSTMAVLQFLRPRLQHGMIIAFDDYYCWSSSKPSGERLAVAKMFGKNPTWRLLPYVQFGWHGMSFVVEAVADGSTLDHLTRVID